MEHFISIKLYTSYGDMHVISLPSEQVMSFQDAWKNRALFDISEYKTKVIQGRQVTCKNGFDYIDLSQVVRITTE